MTIGVYYPEYDWEHRKALEAFYEGLQACQVPSFIAPTIDFDPRRKPDYAVVFGVYKRAVPASRDRGRIMQEMGPERTLVLETGYVLRHRYFACGWGGLNGRADFRNQGMPTDRWFDLGTSLKPWRKEGNFILLCSQVPWDASVQDHNHLQWVLNTAETIQRMDVLPLRFTPHPKGPIFALPDVETAIGKDLQEKMQGAHCVVTYSSNSAVEAVIDGIPALAFDKGSMAWEVTGHDFEDLVEPPMPDRYQWISNLAYTQWTLEEFRSGAAWRHVSANEEQDDAA